MEINFESVSTLITLILGGGGAAALFSLIKSIYDRRSGKTDRERQENKETLESLKQQSTTARKEADEERAMRLEAEMKVSKAYETLSYLRRVALEHGVPPTEVYKIINLGKDS